ncbi:MAG TPA: hypothetical protein VMR95_01730 [Candidatus Binatia bacterium]|nr:hypothetical protein [Candidatus Binatia bacterium]
MAAQAKDTIYIDIDDEITVIIDKLKNSQSKIVALVLPKRATVFQSSVNMKLLKKTADASKKRLVLITSEANLLPLAGSIGLYVAKNLQSKPAIPDFTSTGDAEKAIDTLEMPAKGDKEDFDKEAAADQPVGELADSDEEPKKAKPELAPIPIPRAGEPDDTIEMDKAESESKEEAKKDEKAKPAKDKSLKIPNFNKFRTRLIIAAILLILLIIGWVLLNGVLAKAKITITSQTTSVNASLSLTLDSTATSPSQSSLTLPAHLQQIQKTVSESVTTTGQQNNGTAATGTVTMTAQECAPNLGNPQDIPAGTGILSSNNLTYITQNNTVFAYENSKGTCINFEATSSTPITAQEAGTSYNLTGSSNSFTVSGRSDVAATGSASGGTDDIVQTVTQNDVNNATAKLTAPVTATIKTALESALTQAGYYPMPATLTTGSPTSTDSANVGAQASSVTVSQTTGYTMFGVHESQLQSMLDSYIDSQINTSKQSIISDGFNQASYTMTTLSTTAAQVAMQDTGEVGLHLNVATLKTQVAGKKTGQVISLVSGDPGVTNVKVNLSPFWVSSVPSKTSKITVILQSATHAKST